jgi:hypothetical protein
MDQDQLAYNGTFGSISAIKAGLAMDTRSSPSPTIFSSFFLLAVPVWNMHLKKVGHLAALPHATVTAAINYSTEYNRSDSKIEKKGKRKKKISTEIFSVRASSNIKDN